MLRYGIPSYRLPREKLQYDLDAIIATGVQIKLNTEIGRDISFNDIRRQYDAVFIAIGAHADKKLKIAGVDKKGVISAVEFLRGIGDETIPDFTGRKVVIVGGGNVAMDAARVSVRLGAEKVSVLYRRRERDMTALPSEVEEAIAEGVEILSLNAQPVVTLMKTARSRPSAHSRKWSVRSGRTDVLFPSTQNCRRFPYPVTPSLSPSARMLSHAILQNVSSPSNGERL
jgi:NADPH-dependent glutamate synthase beta subunit-like oxidoreductase